MMRVCAPVQAVTAPMLCTGPEVVKRSGNNVLHVITCSTNYLGDTPYLDALTIYSLGGPRGVAYKGG